MSWFKQVVFAIVFIHLSVAQSIRNSPTSDKDGSVETEISAKTGTSETYLCR